MSKYLQDQRTQIANMVEAELEKGGVDAGHYPRLDELKRKLMR